VDFPQVCPGCELPLVEAESMTFVECDGVVWAAHLWCYMRDGMRAAKAEALLALFRLGWTDPSGSPVGGPPAA
jgi:hypothetical protein